MHSTTDSMNPEPEENAWKKLLSAAKEVDAATKPTPDAAPPDGFIPRMRLMREGLWTMAKTLFWRRWSLVAVIIALALYGLARLLLQPEPTPSISPPAPPTPLKP